MFTSLTGLKSPISKQVSRRQMIWWLDLEMTKVPPTQPPTHHIEVHQFSQTQLKEDGCNVRSSAIKAEAKLALRGAPPPTTTTTPPRMTMTMRLVLAILWVWVWGRRHRPKGPALIFAPPNPPTQLGSPSVTNRPTHPPNKNNRKTMGGARKQMRYCFWFARS